MFFYYCFSVRIEFQKIFLDKIISIVYYLYSLLVFGGMTTLGGSILDYNDREPIYLQIINDIKFQMAIGKLLPSEQLPTIKEQAAKMRVNPNTVARVYAVLEQQNIITKHKGLGCFVSTDPHIAKSLKLELAQENVQKFFGDMIKLNFNPDEIISYLKAFIDSLKSD